MDGLSVIDRLSARDAERQANQEKRAQESTRQGNPLESSAAFLESFNNDKATVIAALEVLLRSAQESRSVSDVNRELADLSEQVNRMEKGTSEASYFLPPFDMRQVTAAVTSLRGEIESVRSQLLPREAFSFSMKNRAKRAARASSSASEGAESVVTPPTTSAGPPSGANDEKQKPERGVRGLENQVVVRTAEELGEGDFALTDLRGCTVFLLGPLSALRIHKLRDCQVLTGPVAGATFIEDVQDCTLVLASAQVRIHSAHATRLLLRVCSNPIIEHSDSLAFGPYPFSYPGSEAQLAAHGLAQESGLWSQVQDFGWLRASQSPNWRLLAEGEVGELPSLEEAQKKGSGQAASHAV